MAKILIVDDTKSERVLLEKICKQDNHEVSVAVDGVHGLEMLDKVKPDILLLDVMMPRLNGFEVAKKIREDPKNNLLYIIFITAKTKEKEKVTGFDVGADDYVVKPYMSKELLARIERGYRHVMERKNANLDTLTRLYNRHFFNIYYEKVIEISKRHDHPLSLILLDIDDFKTVNDTYGHGAGDKILIELAKILMESCRSSDIACRWGGEEFLILLAETDCGAGKAIAERIRDKIEKHKFPVVKTLTASFGVACFDDDEANWFQNVDIALYKAKEQGKNQVVAI